MYQCMYDMGVSTFRVKISVLYDSLILPRDVILQVEDDELFEYSGSQRPLQ